MSESSGQHASTRNKHLRRPSRRSSSTPVSTSPSRIDSTVLQASSRHRVNPASTLPRSPNLHHGPSPVGTQRTSQIRPLHKHVTSSSLLRKRSDGRRNSSLPSEPKGLSGFPLRGTCKGACPPTTPAHDPLTRPPTRHDLARRTSPTTAEPLHMTSLRRPPRARRLAPRRLQSAPTASDVRTFAQADPSRGDHRTRRHSKTAAENRFCRTAAIGRPLRSDGVPRGTRHRSDRLGRHNDTQEFV